MVSVNCVNTIAVRSRVASASNSPPPAWPWCRAGPVAMAQQCLDLLLFLDRSALSSSSAASSASGSSPPTSWSVIPPSSVVPRLDGRPDATQPPKVPLQRLCEREETAREPAAVDRHNKADRVVLCLLPPATSCRCTPRRPRTPAVLGGESSRTGPAPPVRDRCRVAVRICGRARRRSRGVAHDRRLNGRHCRMTERQPPRSAAWWQRLRGMRRRSRTAPSTFFALPARRRRPAAGPPRRDRAVGPSRWPGTGLASPLEARRPRGSLAHLPEEARNVPGPPACRPSRPRRSQSLDRVNLHRRGGEQQEATCGACPESRASGGGGGWGRPLLRRSRRPAAGVVGLVQHHQVPGFCRLEQVVRQRSAADEWLDASTTAPGATPRAIDRALVAALEGRGDGYQARASVRRRWGQLRLNFSSQLGLPLAAARPWGP